MTSPANTLRQAREATVRQHIDAENTGDVEGVVASFHRPHYLIMPMGEPIDGAAGVRDMWQGFLQSFPDFHFDTLVLHHADSAVVLEGRMSGTQRGEWAGLKPAGRRMDVPVACVFKFEGERLMNETIYFDFATAQRQLTAP